MDEMLILLQIRGGADRAPQGGALGGLLSFLLFAAFFYLMMRFGCGAHLVHGGHGGEHRTPATPLKDPVCGMEVGPDQGYGKTYAGREYRFCSRSCLDQFEADPERYRNREGERR